MESAYWRCRDINQHTGHQNARKKAAEELLTPQKSQRATFGAIAFSLLGLQHQHNLDK